MSNREVSFSKQDTRISFDEFPSQEFEVEQTTHSFQNLSNTTTNALTNPDIKSEYYGQDLGSCQNEDNIANQSVNPSTKSDDLISKGFQPPGRLPNISSLIGGFSSVQGKEYTTINPVFMSPTSDLPFAQTSDSGMNAPVDVMPTTFMFPETDRSQDAWIPSQTVKEILTTHQSSPGLDNFDKSLLCMPGIAIKEVFGDPVKNLVQIYLGEEKASQRQSATASSVTQDDRGLRQLIHNDCLHAAINLTTHLLTVYGQGEGRLGQPSKHTIHSVRLWFIRISLLIKLRRFSLAEVECQAFGDLDSPDLYFEFYPDLYGGRKGSLVPFPFRLLVAELSQYLGKHTQALNKLGEILSKCDQILQNLSVGKSEDGSDSLTPPEIEHGLQVWKKRRVRTMYALTSCAVGFKDFRLASSLIERLLCEDPSNGSGLYSAFGRLALQFGDISLAQESFKRHLEHSPSGVHYDPVQGLLHSAYICCAQNNFRDSKQILQQAHKLSPDNVLVVNNLAVACMFLGEIREAIKILEEEVFERPNLFLHEAIILNLSTLYELESPNDHKKKLKLLALISDYKGDGFNVGALKLQI